MVIGNIAKTVDKSPLCRGF